LAHSRTPSRKWDVAFNISPLDQIPPVSGEARRFQTPLRATFYKMRERGMTERSRHLQDQKTRVLELLRAAQTVEMADWRTQMPSELRETFRASLTDAEIDRMTMHEFVTVRGALAECANLLERANTESEIEIALKTVSEVTSKAWWSKWVDQR
jgi:hypothetical protein